MKKKLSALLCVMILLASCGMSAEEITAALEQVQNGYEIGDYTQAYKDMAELEKAYKKMTEEQRSEYDTLNPLVSYAFEHIETINGDFETVDGYLAQKLYYEANTELGKISAAYELPPTEQKRYDEKYTVVQNCIKNWKVTEALKEIETAWNNNDAAAARNAMDGVNVDALSADQQSVYQGWKSKIDALDMLKTAEKQYNNKQYSAAASTLKSVNTALLNENQNKLYSDLNAKIKNALEEIKRQEEAKKQEELRKQEEAKKKAAAQTYTDGAVTLTGTLVAEKWSHNSGEVDPNGDMTAYIFKLDSPANFTVNGKTYSNVTELQLWGKDPSESYIGKKVKITGTVSGNGGTFYYRRNLVIFQDSITGI